MLPGSPGSPAHRQPDRLRHVAAAVHGLAARLRSESRFIAVHHAFQHPGCDDAGKSGAACRHRERQSETNEVVRRIANDRLVKVAHLNRDRAVHAADGTKISDVAVAADPDWRPLRQRRAVGGLQPFIKPVRAAPNISRHGRRHFAIAVRREKRHPFIRPRDCCLSHSANDHIRALPGYPAACPR